MRDLATTHLITARYAFKAVMHPARSILVGCTCDGWRQTAMRGK